MGPRRPIVKEAAGVAERFHRALKLLVALGLLAVGCSRQPIAAEDAGAAPAMMVPPKQQLDIASVGQAYALAIDSSSIAFCDDRGARRLDLVTGRDDAFAHSCAKTETRAACDDVKSMDITVSTPNFGPEDRIETDNGFFWPGGRVHDCAADGKTLAIATGGAVKLIDTATSKITIVEDGDWCQRVEINADWIVWSGEATLHAIRRSAITR